MNDKPARTIEAIYQTVQPNESLPADDPRYVDLTPARGGANSIRQVVTTINRTQPPAYHVHLITGHRGSGKSTELHRIRDQLDSHKFLTIYLDILEILDIEDVEYLDILVAIAENLESKARAIGLDVNLNLLDEIGQWFQEEVITETSQKEVERSLGAEFELGAEIPLFAKMLSFVRAQIKTGSSERYEIRRKLERKIQQFFHRVNNLVDHVTEKAQEKGYKGIVIIVDSLEKMPLRIINEQYTNHALLFRQQAAQLTSLNCHLIYTVPIELLKDEQLGDNYEIDIIPMVQIRTADGAEFVTGRERLQQVVAKRIDIPTIFSDPNLVDELISASGGVIRDLMKLLLASATASESKIEENGVKQAIKRFNVQYGQLIQIDDLELLRQVVDNPYLGSSPKLSRLLYNRLVLQFVDDSDWIGVHPAILQSPKFRIQDKTDE